MELTRNVVRKYGPKAAVLAPVALGTKLALADSAAAVAAITGAQTDALAVVGGLTAMGIAIWAGVFIYRKFFK